MLPLVMISMFYFCTFTHTRFTTQQFTVWFNVLGINWGPTVTDEVPFMQFHSTIS